MALTVFVGSAFVAQYPQGGGNFWVPLQWLAGLRARGVDAWWLEVLWTRGDAATDRAYLDTFWRYVRELGVGDRVVVQYFPAGSRDAPAGPATFQGMVESEFLARARDALLLNLAHSLTAPLRTPFARTVLFDLDPGPFQIWAAQWDMGVGRHDVHLTIGQNLGAADAPVPLGGVAWARTWPTVYVPMWPAQRPELDGAYSTVTQWWSQEYAFLDGETYDCNKRNGFLPLIDVPRRAGVAVDLAANVHADERDDRALLARHGWTLVDPAAVAGTPETFRGFVQRARGEFSAAKPAYVKARPGWISDRTLCYLASGRPCVVEATGAESHLPVSPGLRFFRTADEAVEVLREVEADYPSAAKAARRLAEDVFATDVVVPQVLQAVGW